MLVRGDLFSGVNGKRVDSDPLSRVLISQNRLTFLRGAHENTPVTISPRDYDFRVAQLHSLRGHHDGF